MENDNNVTSVARIERMIARLKRDNPLVADWEGYKVPFTYVCASLFPKCYENVQKTISDSYTKGYIQGREDANNENSRN